MDISKPISKLTRTRKTAEAFGTVESRLQDGPTVRSVASLLAQRLLDAQNSIGLVASRPVNIAFAR